ncbi:shikimate dehydrogenase family protein [Bacteroidota bacterium]
MKVYGLIGEKLSHSFSEQYFSQKFEKEKISDCRYKLFPLLQINDFAKLIEEEKQLIGLNVTIPYKESIIPFLDELDPVSEEIAAVNTIKIKRINNQTKLIGYNTDVFGFKKSIEKISGNRYRSALVLGTGGASKAICFVLKKLGINYYQVSRNRSGKIITYSDIDKTLIINSPLIINCTPLGMFPDIDSSPPLPYDFIGKGHILYDLVYNPANTKFLSQGEKRGAICFNGHKMLVYQAEESWRIWNSG